MPCRTDFPETPEQIKARQEREKIDDDFSHLDKWEFILKHCKEEWQVREQRRLDKIAYKEKIDEGNELKMSTEWGQTMVSKVHEIYGETAMANLLCEAMSKLPINLWSEDLKFWYEMHKRQDAGDWSLTYKELQTYMDISRRRKVVR